MDSASTFDRGAAKGFILALALVEKFRDEQEKPWELVEVSQRLRGYYRSCWGNVLPDYLDAKEAGE